LIERDPPLARRRLQAAIAKAEALPRWDVRAQKARSFSTSALVEDAGRGGRLDEALALLAAEAGAPPPGRCALGVAVDFDQLLVAARGPGGELLGSYEPHRAGAPESLAAARVVPDALKDALGRCDAVDVFARPPLQGRADLLPPSVAWRYRVGHPAAAGGVAPPRRVVIADVEPSSFDLPALPQWTGSVEPGAPPALRGAAATPERVLD